MNKVKVYKVTCPVNKDLGEGYAIDQEGVNMLVDRILGFEMGLTADEFDPGMQAVLIEVVEVEQSFMDDLEPFEDY